MLKTSLLLWKQVSRSMTNLFVYVILLSMSAFARPLPQPVEAKDGVDAVQVSVADGRRVRKEAQLKKELDGLIEDNAGKTEMDRLIIWRKIQKYLACNDDIGNE